MSASGKVNISLACINVIIFVIIALAEPPVDFS